MTETVQIIDGQTCVVDTGRPYIAPAPERVVTDRQFGWNASAYSLESRTGSFYVQFNLPDCIGAVVGIAPSRVDSDPRHVPHGFYIYVEAGRRLWAVIERGVVKTAPVVRAAATDVFRIERRGGLVHYLHNGAPVYASTLASDGAQVVVACLYASDDGVN